MVGSGRCDRMLDCNEICRGYAAMYSGKYVLIIWRACLCILKKNYNNGKQRREGFTVVVLFVYHCERSDLHKSLGVRAVFLEITGTERNLHTPTSQTLHFVNYCRLNASSLLLDYH